MSIAQEFNAFLSADPVVGSLVGDRIWMRGNAGPNPKKPYIIMRQLAGEPEYELTNGDTGLRNQTREFMSFGATHSQAEKVSDAVSDVLSGFQGDIGNIHVERCFVVSEISDLELPFDGNQEDRVFAHGRDYEFVFRII